MEVSAGSDVGIGDQLLRARHCDKKKTEVTIYCHDNAMVLS